LEQEKAEIQEDLHQKMAEIVDMHKEVEEKSEEVAEKAKQIDELLMQLKESTRFFIELNRDKSCERAMLSEPYK
jgi:peptidoglycan hydrolase CwlO-like protein